MDVVGIMAAVPAWSEVLSSEPQPSRRYHLLSLAQGHVPLHHRPMVLLAMVLRPTGTVPRRPSRAITSNMAALRRSRAITSNMDHRPAMVSNMDRPPVMVSNTGRRRVMEGNMGSPLTMISNTDSDHRNTTAKTDRPALPPIPIHRTPSSRRREVA